MLTRHECRQVGDIITYHEIRDESGIHGASGEMTPVFACTCGALVWDPEQHRVAIATTALGLG